MRTRIPFRRVDGEQALTLLRHPKLALYDVRLKDDYDNGHLPGARHLTVTGLSDVIARTPKATPILIYCYHGYASQEYAQALSDFGFEEVYSLDGGYAQWGRLAASAA